MFISHKDNKIIAFSQVEWECRFSTKKIPLKDYWTWLESVTTDGVPDYSGEDYSVEEVDQDMDDFLASGHITSDMDGDYYHLKWDSSSKKVVGDDDAKDAWILSQEWKRIRTQRNRLLSESDWTQGADSPLTTQQKSDWAVYRTSLRTLPEDQSSVTSYSDINWPTKPS